MQVQDRRKCVQLAVPGALRVEDRRATEGTNAKYRAADPVVLTVEDSNQVQAQVPLVLFLTWDIEYG